MTWFTVARMGKHTTPGLPQELSTLRPSYPNRQGALNSFTMRECPDYSRPDHRSAVRRFLRLNPDLEQMFDGTWIAAALQPLKPRSELPPIFWALANPASHGRLTQALTLISEQRSIRP